MFYNKICSLNQLCKSYMAFAEDDVLKLRSTKPGEDCMHGGFIGIMIVTFGFYPEC